MNTQRTLVLVGVLCALGAFVFWLAEDRDLGFGPTAGGAGPTEEELRGERVALGHVDGDPGTGALPGESAGADGGDARAARSAEGARDATDEARTPSLRPARVQGRLVDAAGEPVPHARVFVRHAPEPGAAYDAGLAFAAHLPLDVANPGALFDEAPVEVASGADGVFAVTAVPPGRLQILVTAPGHVRWARDDLLAVPGATLDLETIVLATGARVELEVRDRRGRPIEGAALVLDATFAGAGLPPLRADAGTCVGLGDERGIVPAPTLGPGSHPLVLCAPGHAPLRIELDGARAERTRHLLPEAGRIFARLPAAPADVTAEHGRAPAAAGRARVQKPAPRRVRALPAGATGGRVPFELRADGVLRHVTPESDFVDLSGLEVGRRYEVRSASPVQAWDEVSPWNPPRIALARDRRELSTPIDLVYRSDARVKGTVTSPLAGASLSGLELRIRGASPSRPIPLADLAQAPPGRTLALRLAGLRPLAGDAEALLSIRTENLATREVLLALVPGEELDLETIELVPVPRARLVLVDRETKRPVRGARVTSEPDPLLRAWTAGDLPGVAVSDDRGRVELPTWGLPNTRFSVDARGYAPTSFGGLAPDVDAVPEVVIELTRGTPVRVRVVDQDGAPLPGVRVERRDGPWSPDDERARLALERPPSAALPARPARWNHERQADGDDAAWTDAEGLAHFPRVVAGQHGFFVRGLGRLLEGEWTSRDVPAGEPTLIPLASVRRVSCTGRIFVAAGPLAHAELALAPAPPALSGRSDPTDLRRPAVLLPPGLGARTDADGRFRFANLQPGRWRLAARIAGQRWRCVHDFTLGTEPRPFTIDLEEGAVHGLVVDASGAPVPDATIERAAEPKPAWTMLATTLGLLDMQASAPYGFEKLATTDEQGRFHLYGLHAHEVTTLRARRGVHEASAFLEPDSAPGAPAVLRLEPRGALTLALEGAEQAPGAETLVVAARREGDGPILGIPITAGVPVLFAALAPGEWNLLALPLGGEDASGADREDEVRTLIEWIEGLDARTRAAFASGLRSQLARAPSSQAVVVAGETHPVGVRLP